MVQQRLERSDSKQRIQQRGFTALLHFTAGAGSDNVRNTIAAK
jgi:hypothetical protein